uniref:Uncharacterized protein n=1 Tax=Arundo donax TaxID=35708 RepID=A0A0A9FKZ9_ARUDO
MSRKIHPFHIACLSQLAQYKVKLKLIGLILCGINFAK